MPAITFILDLDPEQGLSRAGSREDQNEDRYERKGLQFHTQVREGFLQVARENPERCHVIDAGQGIQQIAAEISGIIASRAGA